MMVLDASRRNWHVPRLAAWSLAAGIVATSGANLAHGAGHGLVSAWPALALVGSFELPMLLIRSGHRASAAPRAGAAPVLPVPAACQDVPPAASFLEQAVRTRHSARHSQRAIARELGIDRRKVKQIIDRDAAA
jgi:hypothetical protein